MAERRHALLVGLVAAGALLAISTELLGAADAIRPLPLLLTWTIAGGAAIGLLVRRRRTMGAALSLSTFDAVLLAAIGVIAAATAFTAVVSPPNSVDAFGYHLARVVYWAQAGSVGFFPTHYFNQLSMPPLAEYAMLHTWVLSGGDRWVNLVQWTGFAGSTVAVSLIAGALGAGRRGQILAALYCATIPNAILQASGAKNDLVLALWLAALVYFILRGEPVWSGLALGLALLTKGTAWTYTPPLLIASIACAHMTGRIAWGRLVPALALCPLLINGPQWWRNRDLSGSILGPASAQDDGRYRWTNDRFGAAPAVANILRHGSQQLAGRSAGWNQQVYRAVLATCGWLGIDPDDPATTWPGTRFSPPVNSNHEADSPNRWHFFFVLILLPAAIVRRQWFLYAAGLAGAFLVFCAVLKYQPFSSRLLLPLFVLAAPLFGLFGERLRPVCLQIVLGVLLLDQARHPLLENWTRPLTGPASILRTSRTDNYFRDMRQFDVSRGDYERAAQLAADAGCDQVGIDNDVFQLEYPLQLLIRSRRPGAHFSHSGVTNASARYAVPRPPVPCAVVCLGCAGVQRKLEQYRALGDPVPVRSFLVYRPQSGN